MESMNPWLTVSRRAMFQQFFVTIRIEVILRAKPPDRGDPSTQGQ